MSRTEPFGDMWPWCEPDEHSWIIEETHDGPYRIRTFTVCEVCGEQPER